MVSPKTAVPDLPEGVAEFIPLNRSNLREDEATEIPAPGARRRKRVPLRRKTREFAARQRIDVEWGRDDSWKEEYRQSQKRWSRKRRLQRLVGRWADSSRLQTAAEFFAPAAIFMVVGMVIFMRLNGWGLGGGDPVTENESRSESQGSALAEMSTAIESGGGETEADAVDQSSNLAAFERVRASASERAGGDPDGE